MILRYTYNQESPMIVFANIEAPIVRRLLWNILSHWVVVVQGVAFWVSGRV